MENKIKLISSVCSGGYNDTMVYDTVIEYLDNIEHIDIEKIWNDYKGKNFWRIDTDLDLNYDTKKRIIENFLNDMPSIYSGREPIRYDIDIPIENKVKTLEGWYKSDINLLENYLHIGDKVDKSIADYFSESNPVICNGEIVQLGGAYSNDMRGKDTYLTIARENPFDDWIYKGACLKGETINRQYEFGVIDIESQNNEIEEENEL